MGKIKVPQLKGYGGAIAANNSMANAFANISKSANDWMGQKERRRSNKVNEDHKVNVLDETKKQNSIINTNKTNDFNFKLEEYQNSQKELKSKKTANANTFKTLYPEKSAEMALSFGDVPSVGNAKNMNDAFGNVNIKNFDENRDFVYGKNKDEKTFNYNANQDNINNNFKRQEIGIKKQNANKSKEEGSSRKTNEILNWLAINKGRTAEGQEQIPFQKFFDNIQNTKKMGVGLRDSNSVKIETERVSKIIGLNAYQMSNHDFSQLDPQQKYEMDNLVITREQGLKSKVPDWMKKDLDNLSAVVYSAGQVSKSLSSNDTGLIDASLNKVNQYLGLGDSAELAKRTLTQSNYQLYSNFMLKSLSGLAVTKPEETRFIKAFGSLNMSDSVVATKIKTNMENLSFRLNNMKKSYDPIVFNYRYGHLQKSINGAVKRMGLAIDGYKNNSAETNQNYVQADGSNYKAKVQEQKTLVKKQRNQETGQVRSVYSDGSVSYE